MSDPEVTSDTAAAGSLACRATQQSDTGDSRGARTRTEAIKVAVPALVAHEAVAGSAVDLLKLG